MKIKMSFECDNCGASGTVDEPYMMGSCPYCHEHHGEIQYYCDMPLQDFLSTIANMNSQEWREYEYVIQECARDLAENN